MIVFVLDVILRVAMLIGIATCTVISVSLLKEWKKEEKEDNEDESKGV